MMLASVLFAQGLLVDTAALASVALIGYLFGRRTRRIAPAPIDVTLLIELARAQCVAKDLEHLIQRVRTEASAALATLAGFQGQIEQMQRGSVVANWRRLRDRADELLSPMLTLTSALALDCDELQQQHGQLMTFAGSRTDPTTGLNNRQAIVEHLEAQLSVHAEGKRRLAAVMVSVAPAVDGDLSSAEDQIKQAARLISQHVRDNDVVGRYNENEFVVLMPRTPLAGALPLSERLLHVLHTDLNCCVWGGVVEAGPHETPEKLLARGETALFGAKTMEETSLFVHDGKMTRQHSFDPKAPAMLDLEAGEASFDAELAASAL